MRNGSPANKSGRAAGIARRFGLSLRFPLFSLGTPLLHIFPSQLCTDIVYGTFFLCKRPRGRLLRMEHVPARVFIFPGEFFFHLGSLQVDRVVLLKFRHKKPSLVLRDKIRYEKQNHSENKRGDRGYGDIRYPMLL